MGVLYQLSHTEYRSSLNPSLLQQTRQLPVVIIRGPSLNEPVKLILVLPPTSGMGKPLIPGPRRVPHDPTKGAPLLIGGDGDHHPAILPPAAVAAMGRHRRVVVSHGFRRPPVHSVIHNELTEEGGERLSHGEVDILPLARQLAIAKGSQDGEGSEESAGGIGVGYARFQGFAIRIGGQSGKASHGFDALAVGDIVSIGAILTIARNGDHDNLRAYLLEGRVVQAKIRHHPRAEILDQNVADLYQLLENLNPQGLRQVEGDSIFIPVDLVVVGEAIIGPLPGVAIGKGSAKGTTGLHPG